jgi:hypothetical protein
MKYSAIPPVAINRGTKNGLSTGVTGPPPAG